MTQLACLKRTIRAFIHKGESYYVAECLDLSVITQGKTLNETFESLQEAVALRLDGENLSELGFADHPTLLVTVELEPTLNVA